MMVKKNKKCNILNQQLVVQRQSSKESGKAQNYTRVGPREFVQYNEEELSIQGIEAAWKKQFSLSLERKGLSCDILAGKQGHSMKHFSNLKVIHIRFIKPSKTSYRQQAG